MRAGDRVDKYILEEKLGQGGMAEVWKARHPALDKVVAIKCLSDRFTSNPEFEQRFLNEGRRQARLRHPNIVPVLDFVSENGGKFLVMEFIEGESLEAYRKRMGVLSVDRVVEIALEVLSALDYAHKLGLVHRDVKPSNILLDMEGRTWLTDFGIALATGEERVTKGSAAVGTPHFMSPEQIVRPREIDHRTDVYSMGCVLYDVLTGRPPFIAGEGDTDFVVLTGHLKGQPEPLRELNPGVPEPMEKIVLQCLAKSPDDRFASAAAVARALASATQPGATTAQVRAAAAQRTTEVPVPATGVRAPFGSAEGPAEGNRRVLALVAGAAVLLAIAGLYIIFRPAPPADNPPPVAVEQPRQTPATVTPAALEPAPAKPAAEQVAAAPIAPVRTEAAKPDRDKLRKLIPKNTLSEQIELLGVQAPDPAKDEQERRNQTCRALGLSDEECRQRFKK